MLMEVPVKKYGRWYLIPAGQKFTAKKNFASSMQSHKIGAVNSYTDLYKQVGLSNEAMQREGYSDVRVSVYELPFFVLKSQLMTTENLYMFSRVYILSDRIKGINIRSAMIRTIFLIFCLSKVLITRLF